MSTFQKISSAVVIFGLLGLTACEQKTSTTSYERHCSNDNSSGTPLCWWESPSNSNDNCDFICTKPNPNDISTDGGGKGW